jgi:hypothetical protein
MATVIRGSDNFDTAFAKSVAIIADVKAYNVSGGTFTAGAWQTRDLNTELDDPENIVTITSNQFTLQAGTYLVEWSTPAYRVGENISRLQNITDSTTDAEGMLSYAAIAENHFTVNSGAGIVNITSAKVFEIQHQCNDSKTTNGFGINQNVDSNSNGVFTLVKIHKIGA